MNLKSIRFRITLWYGIAFLITLAIVLILFYLITRQLLYTQVDQILTSHGNKLASVVSDESVDLHRMTLHQELPSEFEQTPGMYVAIVNESGDIVTTTNTSDNNPENLKRIGVSVLKSTQTEIISENINNTSLRIWAGPIYDKGVLSGVIIVGHPIDAIQSSLTQLILVLSTIYFLLALISLVIGYIVARSALRPITLMSENLKRVTSENLNETVPNPYSHDELSELAYSFNSLLGRLNSAFQNERQLIGDLAHELKTPISVLRGNMELALSKPRSTDEYRHTVSDSLTDINRISTTLTDILDLAWAKSGKNIDTQTINLSELIFELKDISSKLVHNKKITIGGKVEKNIYIKANKEKLFRALLNLVDNAVKYTHSGRVSISLSTSSDHVLIKISDTGIGINPLELPNIFSRHYRGQNAKKVKGSGLGLSISQSLIEAHKGKLILRNRPRKGVSVFVYLPPQVQSS